MWMWIVGGVVAYLIVCWLLIYLETSHTVFIGEIPIWITIWFLPGVTVMVILWEHYDDYVTLKEIERQRKLQQRK